MSRVCVVLSMDYAFIMPTEVLLRSLDANYHGTEKLNVKVLVPSSMEDFEFVTEFKNLSVEMVPVPQMQESRTIKAIETLTRNTKLPAATAHRFFVGDLINGYEKAIYIDGDCVIARDIQPMLDYNLQTPLAALHEIQIELPENPTYKDTAYFNSGVMILNLRWWRSQRVSQTLLELAAKIEDRTGNADQDILNVLFRGNWTPLPTTFNYLINIHEYMDVKDPIVVHWAGKKKPWISNSPETPWKKLWKQYKNQSRTTT